MITRTTHRLANSLLLSLVVLLGGSVFLSLFSGQAQAADPSGVLIAAPPVAVASAAIPIRKTGYRVTVGTEWVHLQTSIWNPRGKGAVLGLTKEDFELFEDEERKQVDLCFAGETPFHLVLLLDVSASTTPYVKTLTQAAGHFLDILRPEDRVAVVAFNSEVSLLQPFTADRAAAKRAIRATRPKGNTALYDALISSLQLLKSVSGRKAIVVFSDGADNQLNDPQYGSKATFNELQRQALQSDCLIYPAFLQGKSRGTVIAKARSELERLADDSGARFYPLKKAGDLAQAYTEIALDLRNSYTLAYRRDQGETSNSWHALRVLVRNQPDVQIRARKSFFSGDVTAD